jgi:hypothetical protein
MGQLQFYENSPNKTDYKTYHAPFSRGMVYATFLFRKTHTWLSWFLQIKSAGHGAMTTRLESQEVPRPTLILF